MEINNFRLVGAYDTEPPYLSLLETWNGYEIYESGFNSLIQVVKNPEDNKFYSFENNGRSNDYLSDIKCCIRVKWKLTDEENKD